MDPARRAFLGTAASALAAGCTWTSRWDTGDRPAALRRNRSEDEERACEEWDDEPGNLSASIDAPPILRLGDGEGLTVTVTNDGVGDACYVGDLIREEPEGNVTLERLALRVPPGRSRRVTVRVAGAGTQRFRLGDGESTGDVLLVPGPSPFGTSVRYGGLEVAVEDLVFTGGVERAGGGTVDAPEGEVYGFVRVAATGAADGACACLYGDVEVVTPTGVHGPVPDAGGVLRGRNGGVRPENLGGRFAEVFQNQPVSPGETAEGWVPFQLPAAASEQDPLVRLGGEAGAYWG